MAGFRTPNFDLMKTSLKNPVIFDGRNLYDPKRLEKRGLPIIGSAVAHQWIRYCKEMA